MDAPASDTITYLHFKLFSLIKSAHNFSLSRDAVPFPIAIISILYLFIKSKSTFLLSSKFEFELANGFITVEY